MTTSKSALVTGGSRGIGLGIAPRLSELGYALTVTARDAATLDAVAPKLKRSEEHTSELQ